MLKIYNTLSKNLEEFKPIQDKMVTFYQCGPTVYSHQHIGNMFSAVKGDLIRRSLIFLGYNVKYVKNITDVGHLSGDNLGDADTGEDRMEKGAKKEGITPEEIAKKYTQLFHEDINKLNVLPPDVETIATDYIEQMAQIVQQLIDKGFAYATDKAIYFEVDKFDHYNDLNGQKLLQNIEGAGHGSESDEQKKKPYDFAVWFFKTGVHKNALQTWEYKFSGIDQTELRGFPGWHIECSAMSKDTLGETLDIHMGGVEHIPIHHTNEIAQSEAANGVKFVNYWLHHELLLIDGGKMSKSIGNVYLINDLIEKGFSPLDYRYFLLQAHYRSKQNFTWDALKSAKKALNKLKYHVKEWALKTEESRNPNFESNIEFINKFKQSLEEDFNIPKALAVVWELVKADNIPSYVKLNTILDFDKVLGLNLETIVEDPKSFEIPLEAKMLIEERNIAKLEKNWKKSDLIRDQLKQEYGIIVQDTQDGQKIVFED